ncbi:hypothetical protein D3C74_306030 [compost metagenome]
MSKPSIIEYKQFNAKLAARFGNGFYAVRVKVKIGCFPVVNQDRTFLITILTSAQTCAIQLMEGSRHSAKTFFRIDHYSFRCLKSLTGLKPPREVKWIDTDRYTRHSVLLYFRFRDKIAAVNQTKAVYLPLSLVGIWRKKRQKRIQMMRAGTPAAADSGNSGSKSSALHMTFSCP